MPELIPKILLDADIPQEQIIDMFEPLGGKELRHPEYFPDNCHCNDKGYNLIGTQVYQTVKKVIGLDSKNAEHLSK